MQQQGEVSAGHRVDVRALALICAQVQILKTFNKTDFYLLTPTNYFSVSLHPAPVSAAEQTPHTNSEGMTVKSESI